MQISFKHHTKLFSVLTNNSNKKAIYFNDNFQLLRKDKYLFSIIRNQ